MTVTQMKWNLANSRFVNAQMLEKTPTNAVGEFGYENVG